MENTSEIDEQLMEEVKEFSCWLEERVDSSRTRRDYKSAAKGFYRQLQKMRRQPSNYPGYEPENLETQLIDVEETSLSQIRQELHAYISSQNTEYGLKKYLEYLKESSGWKARQQLEKLREDIHGYGVNQQGNLPDAKVLTEEQVETIIERAPERSEALNEEELRIFLKVMYQTAGRIGDIVRLEIRDLRQKEFKGEELEENEFPIHAERSKSKETGVVQITRRTWLEWEEVIYPREYQEEDRIFFPDKKPQRIRQNIRNAFDRGVRDAGLNPDNPAIRLHCLRHTRLTLIGKKMQKDRHSFPEIKEQLRLYARHRHGETTENYVKLLREAKADVSQYA